VFRLWRRQPKIFSYSDVAEIMQRRMKEVQHSKNLSERDKLLLLEFVKNFDDELWAKTYKIRNIKG
jgi:hypothetical protein